MLKPVPAWQHRSRDLASSFNTFPKQSRRGRPRYCRALYNASHGTSCGKSNSADLGTVPLPMTSTDFGKLLADETEKWGKVIRAANIKPE
jgi:hypothetical protein